MQRYAGRYTGCSSGTCIAEQDGPQQGAVAHTLWGHFENCLGSFFDSKHRSHQEHLDHVLKVAGLGRHTLACRAGTVPLSAMAGLLQDHVFH